MKQITKTDNLLINRLVNKINKASDFGYDDEALKLSQILSKYNLTWRWAKSPDYQEIVEIVGDK